MDLVNRLKFFMENRDITISQFADTCMIPRPTMSQILNGRNKKISDELISKIHVAFPELSVLWLMFGEGDMLISKNIEISEPQTSANMPNQGYHHHDIQGNTPIADNDSRFDVFESDKNLDRHLPYQTTQTENSASFRGNATVNDTENGSEPINAPVIDFGEPTRKTTINTFNEQLQNSGTSYATFSGATGTGQENGIRSESGSPTETWRHNEAERKNETERKNGAERQNEAGRLYETGSSSATGNYSPQTLNNATEPPQNASQPNIKKPSETNPLNGVKTDATTPGNTTVHSISTPANKRITNIVVFYSDNSFQSFAPE